MATSPGWATLGSTIAGGNKLNSELAYDNGQALGARTADALQQARGRIIQNNALEDLDNKLSGVPGLEDPKLRAGVVGLIQANKDPEQTFKAVGQNFNNTQRFKAADAANAGNEDSAARALFPIGSNDQVLRPAGANGEFTDVLNPSKGVQMTALGAQIAAGKQAETAATTKEKLSTAELNADKVAHPEKYRILPPAAGAGGAVADGSAPIANETTAQLVAAGQMAPPSAGTKAYMMLGGDDFMKRVNFLSGPGAQATPTTGAPTTQPGGAPAKQPFQANFNGNTFAVNKTTANDFARSTGTGGKLDSVNRIAGHLGVLEDLYSNLNNANFAPTNQLVNYFKQATGKQYPGSAKLAGQMIGTEIVKSMTQAGAGGQEERLNLADAFGPNGTPEGQKTAISTASQLVAEQARDLAMRGSRGGLKGIYEPGKYFSPAAIKRYGLTDPAAVPPVVTPPAVTPPAAADNNDPLGIRGK